MKFTTLVILAASANASLFRGSPKSDTNERKLGQLKPNDFPCVAEGECSCMGDDGYAHGEIANSRLYGCTAEDVKVAKAVVTGAYTAQTGGSALPQVGGVPQCTEGEMIWVEAQVYLWNNANSRRSDVGIWLSKKGASGDPGFSSANSGQCTHFIFKDPNLNSLQGKPILDNVDTGSTKDFCGDMEGSQGKGIKDSNGNILGEGPFNFEPTEGGSSRFPVLCSGEGNVKVDACISYKVPGQDAKCDATGTTEAALRFGTLPGTFSKCECSELEIPIQVEQSQAEISVEKTVCLGKGANCHSCTTETVSGPQFTDVTYCYKVKNTGKVQLDNVVLDDFDCTGFKMPNIGSLPPNVSQTYSHESNINGDNICAATATGTPAGQCEVTDADAAGTYQTSTSNSICQ